MEAIMTLLQPLRDLLGPLWPLVWTLVKIVLILIPLLLCVAYLTFWERKIIGWMQVRLGPNRVGPLGLLQPIADGLKLLVKEIIVPAGASKFLFVVAPIMAIMPALAAWAAWVALVARAAMAARVKAAVRPAPLVRLASRGRRETRAIMVTTDPAGRRS